LIKEVHVLARVVAPVCFVCAWDVPAHEAVAALRRLVLDVERAAHEQHQEAQDRGGGPAAASRRLLRHGVGWRLVWPVAAVDASGEQLLLLKGFNRGRNRKNH
jgi:hypothetical protein